MKKILWLFVVAMLSLGLAVVGCGGDDGDDDPGNDCETVCLDKECGTIGECTCGTCDGDDECKDNMCVAPVSEECLAACDGKECGMVGDCDCGNCDVGATCKDNVCEAISDECIAACEGKICGTFEGCECGTACEEGSECNADGTECVVVCEAVCAADGTPYECGDNGCPDGENGCGECEAGDEWACVDHMCVCTADCGDAVCGFDKCGEPCGDLEGECPEGESCANGECFEGCDFEGLTWDQPLLKLNYLMIDGDGLAGHGLDVDGDAGTCAPVGNCEAGIDNALGGILGQVEQYINVGEELEKIMVEGSLVLLAEMNNFAVDGTEFLMNMYIGDITGDSDACDFQTVKCDYVVDPLSFAVDTCLPVISFDNAAVNGDAFTAGGPGYFFSVSIPIEGIPLTITAVMAKIEGTITVVEGGPTAIDGAIIGGAVPKALIMDVVDNLPDDIDLPVSAELIKGMLDMFIIPDIDAGDEYGDGEPDGEFESASVGIQFDAIEGAVIGMKVDEE